MLDQATEYMDHVLIELVPTVSAEKRRVSIPRTAGKTPKAFNGFRFEDWRARRVWKIARWSQAARLRVLHLHGHALHATFPPVRL